MQHISLPTIPIMNGVVEAMLTFTANYNDTNIATGVKKATIRASAKHPVLLTITAEVITAFNGGTTNVLTVGSDTTATQFLGAADITEATPGFYPAANANFRKRITADTDIYIKYTQTGTAATTGAALIYVDVQPLFPSPSGLLS